MTMWVIGDLDSVDGRRQVEDNLRHLTVSSLSHWLQEVPLIYRRTNAHLASALSIFQHQEHWLPVPLVSPPCYITSTPFPVCI